MRNGVPLGHKHSLRNMLSNAMGASSLAGFWQYWNPIWGYYLGKHIYWSLQKIVPASIAMLFTFMVSGLLHDLAIMLVKQTFTLLFVPWFLLIAIGLMIERHTYKHFGRSPWWLKAFFHILFIVTCLLLTIWLKPILGIS